MRGARTAALLVCGSGGARAAGIDAVMPHYTTTCPHGCQAWSSVSDSHALWLSAAAEAAAGASCAWPGKRWHADNHGQPWCYCNPSPAANASGVRTGAPAQAVCTAPRGVPEQINLQLAAPGVVVANFVTFDGGLPKDPPVAMLGESTASFHSVTGVAHQYVSEYKQCNLCPDGGFPPRTYSMNFVRFAGLEPRREYSYKVRSGAAGAAWSGVFTFRAPYGSAGVGAAAAAAAPDHLSAGESIAAGAGLASPSGAAQLNLQGSDGNLVLYGGGAALWAAGTTGNPGDRLQMQGDGNLVVYSAGGAALWSTGTAGSGAARAALRDDCGLVLTTAGGEQVWSTGTSCPGPAPPPPPAPAPTPPAPPRPPAGAETRIAVYGDMGRDPGNNMANLRDDCASGRIDAIMHMGDHAYNMQDGGDFVGDGYLNVFSQAALASCPWIPIIGNHEAAAIGGASPWERYYNQTWGIVDGQVGRRNSATSALGRLLSKGTLLAPGVHGQNPSGTSQWFSMDLGLIHIVGLDLTTEGPYGSQFEQGNAQYQWLEQDLAAADANRASVPWIIVSSHFPMYFSKLAGNENTSAAYYLGDEAEASTGADGRGFAPCAEPGCRTVGDLLRTQRAGLDPILARYAVDMYLAGHNHRYDSTWPMCNGALCDGERSYRDPKGTVHLTEGNGGVQPVSGSNTIADCSSGNKDWSRMCGSGGAYGRLVAHNATVMSYEHVENPTGKVTDSFAIVKTKAGRGW